MASSLSYGADLRINVVADFRQMQAAFARLAPDKIAAAAAQALNKTAAQANSEVSVALARSFDRPTPWTLRSSTVTRAQLRGLRAELTLTRPPVAGGVPGSKFLAAEITGGTRRLKRSELLLQRIGALPSGWQIAPGPGLKRDPYGNAPIGDLLKILSYFRAFIGARAQRANLTQAGRDKRRRGTRRTYGFELFVMPPGAKWPSGRPAAPGIYRRTFIGSGPRGGRLEGVDLLLSFIRPATYQPRIDYAQIVQTVVARDFKDNLAEALRSAST